MRKIFLFILCFASFTTYAQYATDFLINDSLKAVQYYQEISFHHTGKQHIELTEKHFSFNISIHKKNKASISFGNSQIDKTFLLAKGLHVAEHKKAFRFFYMMNDTGSFKTLVTLIVDSTSKATFYTGYVFFPKEQKWKLIASIKNNDAINYIGNIHATASPDNIDLFKNGWLQRENGSWKHLPESQEQRPTIDVTKNLDSAEQHRIDLSILNKAITEKKIDTTGSVGDVYYKILKEGTGERVNVSDTVTVFYKGSLFGDGSIFDQTKEKPATFPLKRLIKGWQIGLPECKVGGIIRLYIPSTLAYSIRARSKAIPPNSVLVFDVEVVSRK